MKLSKVCDLGLTMNLKRSKEEESESCSVIVVADVFVHVVLLCRCTAVLGGTSTRRGTRYAHFKNPGGLVPLGALGRSTAWGLMYISD